MKITVYFVGKVRDRHAQAIAEEYCKRSSRYAACEMREADERRFRPREAHPTAVRVMLDPAGRAMDSAAFTAMVDSAMRDGRDVVFVLGGADGLSEEWKRQAGLLLSLSPMTFPHELARAMLWEQIYRALAGLRGHPYPR